MVTIWTRNPQSLEENQASNSTVNPRGGVRAVARVDRWSSRKPLQAVSLNSKPEIPQVLSFNLKSGCEAVPKREFKAHRLPYHSTLGSRVFKAHRLSHHSTLGSRVKEKKKKTWSLAVKQRSFSESGVPTQVLYE